METTMTVTTPPLTTPRPLAPAPSTTGFVTASGQAAQRTIRTFVRTPQLVVVGTIQGMLFLLIFRYVFGGAIHAQGASYVDFLVPGFVVTSVLFMGSGASAGVAEDADAGLVDRLRSMPIPRGSVVVGRVLADTALLAGTLLATIAVGFAVGFRVHTDPGRALAAYGLCVVAGFAFDWLFVLLGLAAGNAQAAQGMAMIVFPLTFASSAYVPTGSMPGWLQAFARHQPLTPMTDAVRALVLGPAPGQHTGHLVVDALAWCVALVVVFAPLAVARFHRG
jgi:ABC transporter DrrB family efflux protein